MNTVDIILVILLALSVISGFRNGLIKELASLAGLILGIYAAIHFSDVTADFIGEFFKVTGKYQYFIAFVITLVMVVIVIAAIAKIVDHFLKALMLTFLNRLAGAIFGFIKGMLGISLFIMLLGFLKIEDRLINPNRQEGSRFYGDVKGVAPWVFRFFDLDQKIENLKKWGEDETKENNSKA
ncbi:hypothetical protein MASR2M12_17370 [Bacteroidales bacterium]